MPRARAVYTRPAELRVELNCLYPRYACCVTDDKGTANGGYWRGFRTHTEMFAWLDKHGYTDTQEHKETK